MKKKQTKELLSGLIEQLHYKFLGVENKPHINCYVCNIEKEILDIIKQERKQAQQELIDEIERIGILNTDDMDISVSCWQEFKKQRGLK